MIKKRFRSPDCRLTVFWVQVSSQRSRYAEKLSTLLSDVPAAVLVVRRSGFNNPNSFMSDLVEFLDGEEECCTRAFSDIGDARSLALVLLARAELGIVPSSSPVPMPAWFPGIGGMTVLASVSDLTMTVETGLDAAEGRLGNLREHLYRLDLSMLRRLEQSYASDRLECAPLQGRICEKGESLDDLLQTTHAFLDTVSVPSAFRPSAADGKSLVARIWRHNRSSAPSSLGRTGRALARALRLPDILNAQWHAPLASAVSRTTDFSLCESQQFCLSGIVVIGEACQLVTAAAHADQYPEYPVVLLRSVSYDLRRFLSDAEWILANVHSDYRETVGSLA
jgi:hypothetical protein